MNDQPVPIDYTAARKALTATARAAFIQLAEVAINLHPGGWAASRIAAIDAGEAAAEIKTSFGPAAAPSAITFADSAGRICLAELDGTEDGSLQDWTQAVWGLCALALHRSEGKAASIAAHDNIIAGRTAVTVWAHLSQGPGGHRSEVAQPRRCNDPVPRPGRTRAAACGSLTWTQTICCAKCSPPSWSTGNRTQRRACGS